MTAIRYRGGYKYQVAEPYVIRLERLDGAVPEAVGIDGFVGLAPDGTLEIGRGYAWDGPSGPTIDTRNFMRGSLVHDALYQLLRAEMLAPQHRETADRILRDHCRQDGMSRLRAWWVYRAVRVAAGPAADPVAKKPVLQAPRG